MTQSSDDPTPPDPAPGLSDPRAIHQGPEMFGPGADVAPDSGPDEAPVAGPSPSDEAGDPDSEPRGLVDPRGEIPDPSAP